MTWLLSPFAQRTSALMLFMLAVLLVWNVSGGLYVDHLRSIEHSIVHTQETIARFSRLSTQYETLQATLKALHKTRKTSEGLFSEQDEARAVAALQSKIKSIITNKGGAVIRLSTLPTAQETPYDRISIKTEIDADMTALSAILSDVSMSVPLVFIEHLHIREASQATHDLHITLSVFGYFSTEEAR